MDINENDHKINALSPYPDIFEANMNYYFSVLCVLLSLSTGYAGDESLVKKDLSAEWVISDGKDFFPFTETRKVSTIYFQISPTIYKGDQLEIYGAHRFSIFINGILYKENLVRTKISIDSLSAGRSEFFLIAVHAYHPVDWKNITTQITSRQIIIPASEEPLAVPRASTSFRDFVITAMLILFTVFVAVIRLNPQLSADYFSIKKIIISRESEDDHYARLTSANILFYAFASFILSLFLMIVDHFSPLSWVGHHQADGFFSFLLNWIFLGLIIVAFLLLKMMLLFLATLLFNIRDVAGFHFFSFMRITLLATGFLVVMVSTYFIMQGQNINFYTISYTLIGWVLAMWVVIIFFKLATRTSFTWFHLFSYICATEIIPFLLIINILYE
jgi:hypothetical protein